MDGSILVSIVAVFIAAGSLVIAIRADRRAGRAESRGLHADLVVEQTGSTSDPKGRRVVLRVRNVGLGVARGVHVWLEDEAGHVVSSVAGGESLTLAPDQDGVPLSVTVSEAALPPPPVAFPVLVSWSDGAGEHEREHAGVTATT
jgi:hypothetical protein